MTLVYRLFIFPLAVTLAIGTALAAQPTTKNNTNKTTGKKIAPAKNKKTPCGQSQWAFRS